MSSGSTVWSSVARAWASERGKRPTPSEHDGPLGMPSCLPSFATGLARREGRERRERMAMRMGDDLRCIFPDRDCFGGSGTRTDGVRFEDVQGFE